MSKIYLLTTSQVIGSTKRYVYDRVGPHQVVGIRQLRLEHESALRLAEGASLVSLFQGAMMVGGDRAQPVSVLSGTYVLHSTSLPDLKDVIVFVPKEGHAHPPLGEILSKGVALLNHPE